MGEMRPTGGMAKIGPSGADQTRDRVASTSCLVTLLLAAFIALVVLPMSLWLLGIACGGS